MPLVMRLARPCDLDSVMRTLLDRVDWLRQNGSDQRSTSPTFRPRLAKSISLHQTWLLLDSEKLIGAIPVHTAGDPDFWTPGELQHRALYLAKMATAVEHLGRGLGKLLIEWAQDWAARQEMVVVRWDAWRTNTRLLDYYRGLAPDMCGQ